MTLESAPDLISKLDTKLRACAGYPASKDTWYPEAPEGTADTHLVLVAGEDEVTRYAEGTAGISNGDLAVILFMDATVGETKQLALTLLRQLVANPVGIVIRGGNVGQPGRAGRAKRVAGHTLTAVMITLQYGLNA
jgi:hypothetical protein